MKNKLNIYTVGACVGTLLVIFLTMLGIFLQDGGFQMQHIKTDDFEEEVIDEVPDQPVQKEREIVPEIEEVPNVPTVSLDTVNRIDSDTKYVTYAYDKSIYLDPSLFNDEVQSFADNYPKVYEVFCSCVKQYCDEYNYDYALVHIDPTFRTFSVTEIPYITVIINDRELKLCFYTLYDNSNGYLTGD